MGLHYQVLVFVLHTCLPLLSLAHQGGSNVVELADSTRGHQRAGPGGRLGEAAMRPVLRSLGASGREIPVEVLKDEGAGKGSVKDKDPEGKSKKVQTEEALKESRLLEGKSAALLKEDLHLRRKAIKLQKEEDQAKAEADQARGSRAALQRKMVEEKANVVKDEEKRAAEEAKSDESSPDGDSTTDDDLSSLARTKVQDADALSDENEARKNAKRAVKKHDKIRSRAGAVETEEKQVKAKLGTILKKAKNSASNTDREYVHDETFFTSQKFQAKHAADVEKMQAQQEKLIATTNKLTKLGKQTNDELQAMHLKIVALKSASEKGEAKSTSELTHAKEEFKSKEKAEHTVLRMLKKAEKSAVEQKDTAVSVLGEAKKDLKTQNAKIAGLNLEVGKLQGEVKVAEAEKEEVKAKDAGELATHDAKADGDEQTMKQLQARQESRSHKMALQMEAMKEAETESAENKAELEKVAEARQKELSAIKVAEKEQGARIDAQSQTKAEERKEKKLQNKILHLEKALSRAKGENTGMDKAISAQNIAIKQAHENSRIEKERLQAKVDASLAAVAQAAGHVKVIKEAATKSVEAAINKEDHKNAKQEATVVKAAQTAPAVVAEKKEEKAEAGKDKAKAEAAAANAKLADAKAEEKKIEKADNAMLKKLQMDYGMLKGKHKHTVQLLGEEKAHMALQQQNRKKDKALAKEHVKLLKQTIKDLEANKQPPVIPAPVCNCPKCPKVQDGLADKLKELSKTHDALVAKRAGCGANLQAAKTKLAEASSKQSTAQSSLQKEIERLRTKNEKLESDLRQAAGAKKEVKVAKEEVKEVKSEMADMKTQQEILKKVTNVERKLVLSGASGNGNDHGDKKKANYNAGSDLADTTKALDAAKKKFAKCKVDESAAMAKADAVQELADKFEKGKKVCESKMMKRQSDAPKAPEQLPGPM